jgi:E3 ubiquitin-protein ligase DOA10
MSSIEGIFLSFSCLPVIFFLIWLYKEEKRKLRLERIKEEMWQEELREKMRERREEIQRKLKEADEKRKKKIEVNGVNYHIIPQQITIPVPVIEEPEANQHYRQFNKDFVIEKLTLENQKLKLEAEEKEKEKKKKKVEVVEEEPSTPVSFTTSVDSFISNTMQDLMEDNSSRSTTSSYSSSEDSSGSSSSSWYSDTSSSSSSSSSDDSSSSSSSSSDYSGSGGDFGGSGSSSDW